MERATLHRPVMASDALSADHLNVTQGSNLRGLAGYQAASEPCWVLFIRQVQQVKL